MSKEWEIVISPEAQEDMNRLGIENQDEFMEILKKKVEKRMKLWKWLPFLKWFHRVG